jgi:hypothetical protein
MLGSYNIHTKPCSRCALLCKSFLDVLPWYKMFILDLQIDKYHSTAATRTCHGGTEFHNKARCKTKKIGRTHRNFFTKRTLPYSLHKSRHYRWDVASFAAANVYEDGGAEERWERGRGQPRRHRIPHRHDDSEDPPLGELLFCSLGEFFFCPWRRTLLGF